MRVSHPLFGELEYDEYGGYQTKTTLFFSGKDTEVELTLAEDFDEAGILTAHCDTFEALMKSWPQIAADVVRSILKYQNEEWDATDYTQSFPRFTSAEEVLQNITFLGVTLEARPPRQLAANGRFCVLLFHAEWVNNDYRLLSVALSNEKVVLVTDQAL